MPDVDDKGRTYSSEEKVKVAERIEQHMFYVFFYVQSTTYGYFILKD